MKLYRRFLCSLHHPQCAWTRTDREQCPSTTVVESTRSSPPGTPRSILGREFQRILPWRQRRNFSPPRVFIRDVAVLAGTNGGTEPRSR